MIPTAAGAGDSDDESDDLAAQARSMILRMGGRKFGPSDLDVKSILETVVDVAVLESLMERLLDLRSWNEFISEVRARAKQ